MTPINEVPIPEDDGDDSVEYTRKMDIRRFNPLRGDHPLVTSQQRCPGCNEPFVAGDVTTLIPVGPGDDDESRERARNNLPFNAVAVAVHWACATGEVDDAAS